MKSQSTSLFAFALAAMMTTAVYAGDTAKDTSLLTQVKGELAIDSGKVAAGEPAATIAWEGEGALARNAVGSRGYVIFRHQATGHWDKHEPLVNVAAPFVYVPNPKEKARFKDRLYNSLKRKDVTLTLDGEDSNGPTGQQGAALWKTDKAQTAYWDFQIEDDQPHVITLVTCHGAQATVSVALLSDPAAKQEVVSLSESDGAAVVQFTVKGGVRIFLDQTAFTPDDLGKGEVKRHRAPANISAILLD